MEQQIKELAEKLLMTRIEAYMYANPKAIPGAGIAAEWYPACLQLAEAIKKVTEK